MIRSFRCRETEKVFRLQFSRKFQANARVATANTALRLARYFGTSAQFWINLQGNYALELTQVAAGRRIREQVKPRRAA